MSKQVKASLKCPQDVLWYLLPDTRNVEWGTKLTDVININTYISFRKNPLQFVSLFMSFFRCLEVSLLKVMFTCLLSETFGTFWKKAGEFEFRI